MKLNEDYMVVSRDKYATPNICIQILKQPYENVTIYFDNIHIKDEDQTNSLLVFGYTIVESQQYTTEQLTEDELFSECLAGIMQDILYISLDHAKTLTNSNKQQNVAE
jgi:hypothetical protein